MDVVIAGHTHSHLNTRVPNAEGGGDKLVIEANSFGIAYDRVRMTVDRATRRGAGEVRRHALHLGRRGAARTRSTAALVAGHARRIAPLSERVVGRAGRPLLRDRSTPPAAASERSRRGLRCASPAPTLRS